MGGGGGNTTTQTSGVPEWLRPDVQKAFGRATAAHEAGDLSTQAGLTPEQLRAQQIQQELGEDAIAGRGAFDIESQLARDLKNARGNQLASQSASGTLNSARADRATAAALADRGLQHQLTRQQQQSQGAQALRDLGQTTQARAQERADLGHTGLQRLFGYYGSGAAGNTTTQSGGGGK